MTGIIIAFPVAQAGEKIKAILVRSGFHVAGVCTSGAQAIQEANALDDGVVICTYRLPDMLYRELKEYLPAGFRLITVASPEEWAENGDADVVNLSLPLKMHELLSTVEMVAGDGRRAGKRPPRSGTRSPEEQKIIDRAKGILMSRNNMTEEEAHRYLQKTSMDNGTTFTETAQMILAMLDG